MTQLELLDNLPDTRAISQPTTFTNNMSHAGHRWFRYSAGYSGSWCENLIRQHGARRVFDPFAGSGTTLLSAQAAGVDAIGAEAHPFIARVCNAKLLWNGSAAEVEELGTAILSRAPLLERDTLPSSDLVKRIYPVETYRRLAALREAVAQTNSELLQLALVAILRECSPAGTAQWQYVLPDKVKAKFKDPYVAFRAKFQQIAGDMRVMQKRTNSPGTARLITGDARDLPEAPSDWADFVVTSPPYANNFDYADSTRVEMAFLGDIDTWSDLKIVRNILMRSCSQQMSGYDAEAVLQNNPDLSVIRSDLRGVYDELAAVRLTKAGRKAYHSMIVAYFADLAKAWTTVRRVTQSGAECCWVVGDSAPYGVHVPVEDWLGQLALQAGFHSYRFEPVRRRNVKWENRKHRVPLHEGYLWVKG